MCFTFFNAHRLAKKLLNLCEDLRPAYTVMIWVRDDAYLTSLYCSSVLSTDFKKIRIIIACYTYVNSFVYFAATFLSNKRAVMHAPISIWLKSNLYDSLLSHFVFNIFAIDQALFISSFWIPTQQTSKTLPKNLHLRISSKFYKILFKYTGCKLKNLQLSLTRTSVVLSTMQL